MPRYTYRAYDAEGRLDEGLVEAESEKAALDQLARRGRFPVEVAPSGGGSAGGSVPEVPWWRREIGTSGAMPIAAQAAMARELATLVKARLPLDEALRIAAMQPRMGTRPQRVLAGAARRVGEGAALSEALAAAGGAMPEHIWRLVAAGERSGRLPDVLEEIARFQERTVTLRASIVSALLYPCVLIVAALVTLGLVAGVMVPAVMPVFRDTGVPPPLLLATLSAAQDCLANRWPLLLGGLGLLIAALVWSLYSERASAIRDGLVLRTPVAGTIVRHASTARLARSLAMLLGNGVPMVEALGVAAGVVASRPFRAAASDAARAVNRGESLARTLDRSGLLPDLAVRFLRIGEETAQLVAMLERIADVYEHDVAQRLQRLVGIVAPLVTVGIGVAIGGLILSVMTAMLGLNEAVLR